MKKSCLNCAYRFDSHVEPCKAFEMADSGDYEAYAEECAGYEEETHAEEHYTRSSSAGDYSPSCPWNAPGMSISDFI